MILPVGVVVLVIGVAALIGGLLQRGKAGRISKTPFAATGEIAARGPDVAGPKGAVSTQGQLVVMGAALTTPVTQRPCVYYHLRITCEYKSGDKQQKDTISDERQSVPFAVDDGSGPVAVNAGKGGDFEAAPSFRQSRTKGLGAAVKGTLDFGQGLRIPVSGRFNGYMIPDGAKITVEETHIPAAGTFYVNGKLDSGVIGSPSWRSLMIASAGRDQLLASAMKTAKILMIVGAAAGGAGLVTAIVGLVTK
jgi:hypothetical protein